MGFTDAEMQYLDAAMLGRIATTSTDGEPDVSPVGFRLSAAGITVGGFDITATRKYRNVKSTGMAAFVVDDLVSTDPWQPRGVKVVGSAVIERSATGAESIRIRPTTVWSWGINAGAKAHHGRTEKRSF